MFTGRRKSIYTRSLGGTVHRLNLEIYGASQSDVGQVTKAIDELSQSQTKTVRWCLAFKFISININKTIASDLNTISNSINLELVALILVKYTHVCNACRV